AVNDTSSAMRLSAYARHYVPCWLQPAISLQKNNADARFIFAEQQPTARMLSRFSMVAPRVQMVLCFPALVVMAPREKERMRAEWQPPTLPGRFLRSPILS